ncbi:MAG: hypothetical protein RIT45_2966 [Pseudomonadota bacterium]
MEGQAAMAGRGSHAATLCQPRGARQNPNIP